MIRMKNITQKKQYTILMQCNGNKTQYTSIVSCKFKLKTILTHTAFHTIPSMSTQVVLFLSAMCCNITYTYCVSHHTQYEHPGNFVFICHVL